MFFKRFIASFAVLALTACTPIVDSRGHSPQAMDMSQIVEGQSTREDVMALLGSPSSSSDFGGTRWYYITSQKETVGVFAPEITKQKVTQIDFDEGGKVASIRTIGKDKGKEVEIVEKQTPSAGHSMTMMEQLLSNFGKFSTPGRQITPGRGY